MAKSWALVEFIERRESGQKSIFLRKGVGQKAKRMNSREMKSAIGEFHVSCQFCFALKLRKAGRVWLPPPRVEPGGCGCPPQGSARRRPDTKSDWLL